MPTKFLSPDEARELLDWRDRCKAELRAKAPPGCADLYARLFPPVSDEVFRLVMEKPLLGELPDPRELQPLHNFPRASGDRHKIPLTDS